MRKIDKIVIHCSDSPFGDVELIDSWHKERGWDCIGYHFVITNRHPKTTKTIVVRADGRLEHGRPVEKVGSHCYGYNKTSIGICLIGRDSFTPKQHGALMTLLLSLCRDYSIDPKNIFGHSELSTKTCPNFAVANGVVGRENIRDENIKIMDTIRDIVGSRLSWD